MVGTAPPDIGPEMALFDAVLPRLKADADLTRLVNGVYDEVPTGRTPKAPPYVFAGPVSRTRLADSYAEAWTLRLRLYVASTGFGRRQAWTVIAAMSRALDRAELALSGPYHAVGEPLVVIAGDVIEDPVKTAFLDIEVLVQKG